MSPQDAIDHVAGLAQEFVDNAQTMLGGDIADDDVAREYLRRALDNAALALQGVDRPLDYRASGQVAGLALLSMVLTEGLSDAEVGEMLAH